MLNFKTLFLVSGIIAALTGCASKEEVTQEPVKTPADLLRDQNHANTLALLKISPQWYLSPPISSQGDIYEVATAINSDLQFSLNRAVLMAEQAIVKKMATEITSLETEEISNSGGSNTVMSSQYIEAKINQAGLFGHVVSKRIILPDPKTGEFRSYVLIHLPAKAKADVLTAAIAKDNNLKQIKELQTYISNLEAKANTSKQAATTTISLM